MEQTTIDDLDFNGKHFEKCAWKEVAEKDLIKLIVGNKYRTFSVDKPCYDCGGYEGKCDNYEPKVQTNYRLA